MNSQNPKHIGIIMDGNRRYAKKNGLQVKSGHQAGIETLEKIVKETIKQQVQYLTVYALSTENLKNREKLEINDLFELMKVGFTKKLPILKENGVRVEFLGDISSLPLSVRMILQKTKETLANGDKLQLNIAINYGGREEIVSAAKRSTKQLTEESFSHLLYTKDIPDPEIIIRTGGQKRLSNFLPWQSVYSELYFSDKLWPEFDENDFRKIIEDYNKQVRNFGS